jgi:Holliday junction resolvase RusA-like endonuclease
LFTAVKLSTKFKEASSQGFSILAGYIFGGNKENEKSHMTSPVTMSLEDSMTVMFMVPKNLIKKRFKANRRSNFDKNQQNCCCNHFGGWADDTKIESIKKLKQPWTLKE